MGIPEVMECVYYRAPTFEICYRLFSLHDSRSWRMATLAYGFGTVVREHLRQGLFRDYSGGRDWPLLLDFVQAVHQAAVLHLLKLATSSLSVAKLVLRDITALSYLSYESAGVKGNLLACSFQNIC